MASEQTSNRRLSVLLAISEAPLRAGVRRVLERDGLEVVCEASNASEAATALAACEPDVCVIAVQLAGGGIAAAARARQELPVTRILLMTERENDEELYESLQAGADGYLPNTTPAARLPHAVRSVADGEAALSRRLTAELIRELRERARKHRLQVSASGQQVELTARESDVLQRMRKGLGTSAIAGQLHISEITVRRHISAMMHKLEVTDRQQVVELCARAEPTKVDGRAPDSI